jgi:glycerol-3-phosphate dehydrogenase
MKTKRIPIKDLKEKELDVLIIGGGITGACILWDATLRGMKCLLVDKNDYASGTSQATSKLIHGGLRYLKNFEIGLVRESLRERRNLARISPHALYTMGFQIPVYNAKDTVMTKLGNGSLQSIIL